MTFLKFFPSIHIHPILIIFIIISFLTGTFVELFIILSIVLIHELGHYAMATFFNWRIQHIVLWIFGGVMKTEEHGHTSIKEEICVTIAGPFQHILIYMTTFAIAGWGGAVTPILPPSITDLIFYYNTVILLFNLIPIWPLDGGKLLFSSLSLLKPYRQAYNVTIIFSIIASIALLMMPLFVTSFTLSSFFIFIFLLMENRTEWKHRYYVFIRFLLKRYEGKTPIRQIEPLQVSYRSSLMDVFSNFRRDKKHPIYVDFPGRQRELIDESDCLRSYFYEKKHKQTVGELIDHTHH